MDSVIHAVTSWVGEVRDEPPLARIVTLGNDPEAADVERFLAVTVLN